MLKERDLIQQTNTKIEPIEGFDVDRYKEGGDNKFVYFFFEPKISRNKYVVRMVKKCKKEILSEITQENYRGHIDVIGCGNIPLFVTGFDFPLYSTVMTFRVVFNQTTFFEKITAPISFKLKDKEDRLCFDLSIRQYVELADMINEEFVCERIVKAAKIQIDDMAIPDAVK